MPVTVTEVMVELKRPPIAGLAPGNGNYLRLRLSPDVNIAIGVRVKTPGEAMVSQPTELSLVHYATGDEMTPYERLLGDAIAGDPTLFAREDAVEAAWAIVDPILDDATPVHPYEAGTWGPADADLLTRAVGGWVSPKSDA
jgi:glucose-6-phosphate 1-dehydrogenase